MSNFPFDIVGFDLDGTLVNSEVINFDIVTKDDWNNGKESTDYSDFNVCATCDWKLTCEVIDANGDVIDELSGNGGELPLACIGHKIIWDGDNDIKNNVATTLPLTTQVAVIIVCGFPRKNLSCSLASSILSATTKSSFPSP